MPRSRMRAPRGYNPRSGKWFDMKTGKRIIYLAGPMDNGHHSSTEKKTSQWRLSVMGRAQCCEYKIPEMIEFEGHAHDIYGSKIPVQDLELISRSTELVAFIDRFDRIGTFCEIAAARALGLSVSAVILYNSENDSDNIPWFVHELIETTKYASCMDDAIKEMVELCGGDYLDYHEYINSPEWKERARKAKAISGYRCQVCNVQGDDHSLHAHHRTYDRLGKELDSDITVLCYKCHELFSKNSKLAKG